MICAEYCGGGGSGIGQKGRIGGLRRICAGFVGKVSLNGEVDEALIWKMCGVLVHRGPDDEGVYLSETRNQSTETRVGLGHRRLSIIDLSPAGHQPMCNEDRTIWIVLNREIYNF